MGNLAHGFPEEPGLRHGLQHAGRRGEDEHDEVSDGEVDDEEVRHALHVTATQHDEADEEVAQNAHREDDQMEADEEPLHGGRVDVPVHATPQLLDAADVDLAEGLTVLRDVVPVRHVVQRAVLGGRERRGQGGGRRWPVCRRGHDGQSYNAGEGGLVSSLSAPRLRFETVRVIIPPFSHFFPDESALFQRF